MSAILLCVGFLIASSAAARAIAPWLPSPGIRDVDITPRHEPGGRFVIEGRVLAAGDSTPLAGLTLYVYHADGHGLYALHQDDKFPRIAGVLRTDAQGRYRVHSIVPGQYEGVPHVHFEGWGPNLPLRTWFVNLYMAPGEHPDSAWGRMAQTRRLRMDPNRPETFVTRDAHGVFRAHYDLRWDRGFSPEARYDSLRRGLIED